MSWFGSKADPKQTQSRLFFFISLKFPEDWKLSGPGSPPAFCFPQSPGLSLGTRGELRTCSQCFLCSDSQW